MVFEEKQRIIQEFVPGKQITLAHLIANPEDSLYKKMGAVTETKGALGVMTITPSEGAIIAGDLATKAANVELVFIDRFCGSVVICGDVMSVEAALSDIMTTFETKMGFAPVAITKT